jgi:hypothetical protein
MDFFEISQSIRKVGKDKYIIGKQSSNPLVLVEGKSLKTDIGIFENIISDKSEIKDEYVELSNIDNLILKTGIFNNLSGAELTSLKSNLEESFISNLYLNTGSFDSLSGNIVQMETGFSEKIFIENIDILKGLLITSGNLILTGDHLHKHIDELSENLILTGDHLHKHIDELSENLILTGDHLHKHIDELSGNLILTGDHLLKHIDELSGNLSETGAYLDERIDQTYKDLTQTGSLLREDLNATGLYLQAMLSGQQVISGDYSKNRFMLEEAFEEDEFGDIVPTNHPFISDPMWMLREDGDLELRANVWRYNTGPDAFTKDISF